MEGNSECCDAGSSRALGTAREPWLAGTNSCWRFSCRRFLWYIPLLLTIPNVTPQLCIWHTEVCFTHLTQPHHTEMLSHRDAFPLLGVLRFSAKIRLSLTPLSYGTSSRSWVFIPFLGFSQTPRTQVSDLCKTCGDRRLPWSLLSL